MTRTLEKSTGFTFWLSGIDFFVVTEQKNRTKHFAAAVIAAMNQAGFCVRDTDGARAELCYRLRPATLELKENKHGAYYDIHGDGFGGGGSNVGDGKTVILSV